jgi:hypothetical protein
MLIKVSWKAFTLSSGPAANTEAGNARLRKIRIAAAAEAMRTLVIAVSREKL